MLQLSIGVSALQASQRGLDISGHNIANANTPGYHRQVVQLTSKIPLRYDKLSIGRGVEVAGIQRIANEHIEESQSRQATASGLAEAKLGVAMQLESRIANSQASPGIQLESLFNRLEQLSSQLNSSAARKLVVASADQLTREFNSVATDLLRQRDDVDQAIRAVTEEINPLTTTIARLNGEIAQQSAVGVSANDLLDQRSKAIQELSRRIGIDVQIGNQGQLTVLSNGVPLVISERALSLEVGTDEANRIVVRPKGSDSELSVSGGQLGGYLEARHEMLPRYLARLDNLAREVARAFNSVQTTGVGVAGAFTNLISQQPVRDVTQPLNATGLPFPPTSGSLTVSVTEIATGQRISTTININPAQQSLNDVASSLAEIPNLQAFVNPQLGTLSLMSAPGFTFDFRGDGESPSDSAGLLSAIGLNSLFTGNNAATLKVSRDLLGNADRLATSLSGQVGDSDNLQRFVALRDAALMPNQNTFANDFVQTVADIGVDVQSLTEQNETSQLLAERLDKQQQSLSGVDPNEELVNLLKYQRMFQIASKLINVVNEAYDELLSIR